MQAPVFIKPSDHNGSKQHQISQFQPPFPYGISPTSIPRTPPFQPSSNLTFSMFSSSPHVVWQTGSFSQQFSFTPTGPSFAFSPQNPSSLVLSVTPNSHFSHLQSLEANFCKNFTCCGIHLEDLHGLLEHFEERHVNNMSTTPPTSTSASTSDGKNIDIAQLVAAALAVAQQQSQNSQLPTSSSTSSSSFPAATPPFPAIGGVPEWETMEMDGIEMDLDQDMTDNNLQASTSYTSPSTNMNGRINGISSEIHLPKATPDLLSRHSIDVPSTVASPANSNSLFPSPEGSIPGTPLLGGEELDQELLDQFTYDWMNQHQQQQQQHQGVEGGIHPSFFHGGFGSDDGHRSTIDLLDSPVIRSSQTVPSSPVMSDFQQNGPNRPVSVHSTLPISPKKSPVPKKIKQPTTNENENPSLNLQSLSPSSLLSLSTSRAFAPPPKPFKCPVPGCEKSYKQMNGLKYHRIHGHCNATVTIPVEGEVDPNRNGGDMNMNLPNSQAGPGMTQIELPYDVEESKPYMCHQGGCGKRYKNMNGLRYHYAHSGPHGQLGLQLLSLGSHPPPQYPSGYIPPRNTNGNGNVNNVSSNQNSRTGSRTTSESPPPPLAGVQA